MIKKYWISKWTREWGILESEFEKFRGAIGSIGWGGVNLPKAEGLLARLEETGFVLLDKVEFLLLSKALDERGEPLSFSPLPPDRPAPAQATSLTARPIDRDIDTEEFAQAA